MSPDLFSPSSAAVAPGLHPRVFLAWALHHQRHQRRHRADLAQITTHHDLNPSGDAMRQLQAWAQRRARARQLHTSAMAHLRHPSS